MMQINLTGKKKIFFASDFHLGSPSPKESFKREQKIIRWLDAIKEEADTIFLLGDIFDFWFEYKHVVPKGFIRFQGKLAELSDQGIRIIFFSGNHDMWMFNYFPNELHIPVYRDPQVVVINDKRFLIGHGDGLGPGEKGYKIIKKMFNSRFCQRLFAFIHPGIGMRIAHYWSKKSRMHHKKERMVSPEKEFLYSYCKEMEAIQHHDYYIFGHRHLALNLSVNKQSTYFNLGDWINDAKYGIFDGEIFTLHTFEGKDFIQ